MSWNSGLNFLKGDGATTLDGRISNTNTFTCTETASAMVVGQVVMLDTALTDQEIGLAVKMASVTATSGNVNVIGVMAQATATTDGTNLAKVDVVTGVGQFASAVCDASVNGAGIPLGVDTTAGTFTALAATFAALAAGESGKVAAVSMAASAVDSDGVRRGLVQLLCGR